jgi:hypothetical protein
MLTSAIISNLRWIPTGLNAFEVDEDMMSSDPAEEAGAKLFLV